MVDFGSVGFLSGLAGGLEGASQGMKEQADKKRQTRKDALDEATQQAGILKSGYQAVEDPATGKFNLVKDPNFKDQEKELRDLQMKKLRMDLNPGPDPGKTIPASEAVSFGDSNAAIQSLNDVRGLVKDKSHLFGPGTGTVSGLLGMVQLGDRGRESADVESQLKSRAQILGKYLEGGKLTDQDISRYYKMLPQLSDSPEVVESKIVNLQNLVNQKQSGQKMALKQSGYNVDNLSLAGPENVPQKKQAGLGLLSSGKVNIDYDKLSGGPSSASAASVPHGQTRVGDDGKTYVKVGPGKWEEQ